MLNHLICIRRQPHRYTLRSLHWHSRAPTRRLTSSISLGTQNLARARAYTCKRPPVRARLLHACALCSFRYIDRYIIQARLDRYPTCARSRRGSHAPMHGARNAQKSLRRAMRSTVHCPTITPNEFEMEENSLRARYA